MARKTIHDILFFVRHDVLQRASRVVRPRCQSVSQPRALASIRFERRVGQTPCVLDLVQFAQHFFIEVRWQIGVID